MLPTILNLGKGYIQTESVKMKKRYFMQKEMTGEQEL